MMTVTRKVLSSFTLAILLPMAALGAEGGNSGGGGGAICYSNNTCITLAEAGLRLKSDSELGAGKKKPLFDLATIEELEKIKTRLQQFGLEDIANNVLNDYPGWSFRREIPTEELFIPVSKEDTTNFEKFKQDYAQALHGTGFDLTKFKIVAVSALKDQRRMEPRTYLLPEFENLSPRGKALILIHEKVMRGCAKSSNCDVVLKSLLKFDGTLLDFLENKKGVDEVTLAEDAATLFNKIPRSYSVGDYQVRNLLLTKIIKKMGGKVSRDLIFNGESDMISVPGSLRLAQYDERASRILSGEYVKLTPYFEYTAEHRTDDVFHDYSPKKVAFIKKTCLNVEKNESILTIYPGEGLISIKCDL